LLRDYTRLKREELLKELTAAEREVFDLFVQGFSLAQIEAKMFKTHNT
jgi:NarL family two-component system response regulator LiaR